MLISNNFASQTRWSIFTLGPQMHQAALDLMEYFIKEVMEWYEKVLIS